jgi:hypothetical protein
MEENQGELWEEFLFYAYTKTCYQKGLKHPFSDVLDEWLNPSNLATFLVEHRSKWEWAKCTVINVMGRDINTSNRKIKHPAASWLDGEGIK